MPQLHWQHHTPAPNQHHRPPHQMPPPQQQPPASLSPTITSPSLPMRQHVAPRRCRSQRQVDTSTTRCPSSRSSMARRQRLPGAVSHRCLRVARASTDRRRRLARVPVGIPVRQSETLAQVADSVAVFRPIVRCGLNHSRQPQQQQHQQLWHRRTPNRLVHRR